MPGTGDGVRDSCTNTWGTIVLGAGTSGLTAGSILTARGRAAGPVLLLDEYPEIGGNHTSVAINGYSFDIGSFFFSENSPFLAHFPDLLPRYENQDHGTYSVARITPKIKLAAYPADFKNDVFGQGITMPLRYLGSALYGRIFLDENRSAEDFACYWIGERFFRDSGLRFYMERLFGENPAGIESCFAHKRMRWVKRNAQIGGLLKTLARHAVQHSPKPRSRQLVRPRAGFPSLYNVAADRLKAQGTEIRLGAKLTRISGCAGSGFQIELEDGTGLACRQIVSTIPLSRTLPLCGLPTPDQLRAASLLTLFISTSGDRGFAANVLFNFSEEGQWKRLTMHSDFYGKVHGREYFSVECIMNGTGDAPAARFGEFKMLVRKAGLFPGDLRLEGHRITDNAYPVYRQGATAAAEAAIAQLRRIGILSFGRQGGFDYQPTSVISTIEAKRQLNARPAGPP